MKASDISGETILLLIEAKWAGDGDWAYKVLASRGFPEKVIAAKFDKLNRRGFLEYGVSMRTAWLTPRGREHLRQLRAGVVT